MQVSGILTTSRSYIIKQQLNGLLSYFNTRKSVESELYSKDKICITTDASEWNPHYLSFLYNESALINYGGKITSPSDQTKIPMEPAFDPDEIFEMASVHTTDYDTAVDYAVISYFKAKSQDTSHYDTDTGFASCLK